MPERNNSKPRRPGKPLRVGLIGVTGYALAYFEELSELVRRGLVEWGAVTIINREESAEQLEILQREKVPVYSNYQDMIESEAGRLDWVCVPTAIGWHARMTVDCLARGLPVLLEKPVAPTLQDVAAIQAAENESGLPVAIGYQHSYSRSTWEIKELLMEGTIGRISRVDCIGLWPRGHSYYSRNYWSGRVHAGEFWVLDSPFHNALAHLANLMLFLAGTSLGGRADPVRVMAELYRSKPIQNFDTIWTRATLDSGAEANVILSHSSLDTIDPEIRLTGSKGVMIWRFNGGHTLDAGGNVRTFPVEEQVPVRTNMFNSVVRLLQGDTSVRYCSTEQAKGEVKWINAAQDCIRVHDVPDDFRRQFVDQSGEAFDIIENFEVFATRAYRDGCSFHEAGAPWAVEPGTIETSDYNEFRADMIEAPFPPLEASVQTRG